MTRLTIEEVRRLPAVIDLETAGKALGIARTRAYAMAKNGTFPVEIFQWGRTYRIPTASILSLLEIRTSDNNPTVDTSHTELREGE